MHDDIQLGEVVSETTTFGQVCTGMFVEKKMFFPQFNA